MASCGALWIFMFYSFGTMAAAGAPNLEGAARQAEIWRAVIRQPTFYLGFVMLYAGVRLMFHEPKRNAQSRRRRHVAENPNPRHA